MLYFVNINIDISVSLFDYLFLILILVGLINSLEFQILVSTELFAESLFLTYRASGALDIDWLILILRLFSMLYRDRCNTWSVVFRIGYSIGQWC